tara:strand:- start:460 stop:723 length:264 start_codon:yes stop_codon:yes gene_type:complete
MAASRRGDFATLTHRGRQKVKMGGGDKELKSLENKLASLENNIYGVPRIIEEDAKKLDSKKNGIRYTKPIYHPDGTVTPGRPIPPKD